MNIKKTLKAANFSPKNIYLKGRNEAGEMPLCLKADINGNAKWIAINNTSKQIQVAQEIEGGESVNYNYSDNIILQPGEGVYIKKSGSPTKFAQLNIVDSKELKNQKYTIQILNTNNYNANKIQEFINKL
jgi:hypothetical protein